MFIPVRFDVPARFSRDDGAFLSTENFGRGTTGGGYRPAFPQSFTSTEALLALHAALPGWGPQDSGRAGSTWGVGPLLVCRYRASGLEEGRQWRKRLRARVISAGWTASRRSTHQRRRRHEGYAMARKRAMSKGWSRNTSGTTSGSKDAEAMDSSYAGVCRRARAASVAGARKARRVS